MSDHLFVSVYIVLMAILQMRVDGEISSVTPDIENLSNGDIAVSPVPIDNDSTLVLDRGNDTDMDCTTVKDPQTMKIGANGSIPTRIGRWTLMRWGFHNGEWICDVKGTRRLSQFSDVVDTLGVTFESDDGIRVASGQMQCRGQSGSCAVRGRTRRQCVPVHTVDYCFRLRLRCYQPCVWTKERRSEDEFNNQKWIMFGYGIMCGFVLGCIIACLCMMCIDNSCGDRTDDNRKGRTVTVISRGPQPYM